jgi:hypothetical protein
VLAQADCLLDFLGALEVQHCRSALPNARGKPRRSAKHGGHPQAELVGVGLTNQLGRCAEELF